MPIHVAILQPRYVQAILDGSKTVESRFMKLASSPPFRKVSAGERLFIKVSGGPFRATATASAVHDHADLTAADHDALQSRWRPSVGGDDAYWQMVRDRRCATFIELAGVEPLDVGPAFRVQNMRAWYVLDDNASPLLDCRLTGGALRNHYLVLPQVSPATQRSTVTLDLPDGQTIETGFYRDTSRLVWRGWKPYYEAHAMDEGDAVRLIAVASKRYRVAFLKRR
jgi:hypothetical protein